MSAVRTRETISALDTSFSRCRRRCQRSSAAPNTSIPHGVEAMRVGLGWSDNRELDGVRTRGIGNHFTAIFLGRFSVFKEKPKKKSPDLPLLSGRASAGRDVGEQDTFVTFYLKECIKFTQTVFICSF